MDGDDNGKIVLLGWCRTVIQQEPYEGDEPDLHSLG